MESDSEETRAWIRNHSSRHEQMLAEFVDEIPTRETSPTASTSARSQDSRLLLDALRRHREILRRENDFFRGEVKSRGFATFAGKKAYMENHSNGTATIPPSLLPDELASREIKAVGVSFPYLVTTPQDSLELLLHESNHLRYRIQSLASTLKDFGIPVSSEKAKMRLFLMSRAAAMISKTMQNYSTQDPASSRRLHRAHWESVWGSNRDTYGVSDDITTLSPMLFTPCTPGITPYSATICPALQIYSLKIVDLNVNLNWPLQVYGAVAARDTVDHNRNILFYRSRDDYQLVTEHDPFLRLTGPSRAIVAANHVTFEIELKIKYPGAEERQDRASFYDTYTWRNAGDTTPMFRGYPCAAELSLEVLPRAFQATIVGVRLVARLVAF
ncbi:hypothetical protein ACQ4PT_042593 [Festuca glaucescens]